MTNQQDTIKAQSHYHQQARHACSSSNKQEEHFNTNTRTKMIMMTPKMASGSRYAIFVLVAVVATLLITTTYSTTVNAFIIKPTTTSTFSTTRLLQRQSTCSILFMAKGGSKKKKSRSKGFGSPSDEKSTATTTNSESDMSIPTAVPSDDNGAAASSSSTPTPTMTAGQKALEKLREERRQQKDNELRQIKNLKEQDAVVQTNPDAAVIPERVAQKMSQRMLPFVALPILGSMGSFVAFWYMATYQNYEFQPAVVAITTIGFLAIGLLGITYSMMSTPWDENSINDGSLLGIEEFQTNVNNLREGLSRSRENAKLREQMKGLPESEIEAALRDLERRERKQLQKSKSFEEKMQDEGL